MIGKKRLNEKGFLLMEAIISWLIVVTSLMIYLPFLMNMLLTLQETRSEVELSRIGYEQAQKKLVSDPLDKTWKTAGKTYTISEIEAVQWKGIRVYEKEQEWIIQMETFTVTSTHP